MNAFGIYFIFKIVFVLKRGLELILELYNVFKPNTYFLFYQASESLNFLAVQNFLFEKSKFFKFC